MNVLCRKNRIQYKTGRGCAVEWWHRVYYLPVAQAHIILTIWRIPTWGWTAMAAEITTALPILVMAVWDFSTPDMRSPRMTCMVIRAPESVTSGEQAVTVIPITGIQDTVILVTVLVTVLLMVMDPSPAVMLYRPILVFRVPPPRLTAPTSGSWRNASGSWRMPTNNPCQPMEIARAVPVSLGRPQTGHSLRTRRRRRVNSDSQITRVQGHRVAAIPNTRYSSQATADRPLTSSGNDRHLPDILKAAFGFLLSTVLALSCASSPTGCAVEIEYPR